MARKTSKAVAAVAAEVLDDPASASDSDVATLAGSALSQVENEDETPSAAPTEPATLESMIADVEGITGLACPTDVAKIKALLLHLARGQE